MKEELALDYELDSNKIATLIGLIKMETYSDGVVVRNRPRQEALLGLIKKYKRIAYRIPNAALKKIKYAFDGYEEADFCYYDCESQIKELINKIDKIAKSRKYQLRRPYVKLGKFDIDAVSNGIPEDRMKNSSFFISELRFVPKSPRRRFFGKIKNMNNIEIEIQVNIEKSEPLIDFLGKNAEFKRESHQIDEYFSPSHRNFIGVHPVKEWLRLRDSSGKYSINYKNWHYDESGKSNYCDEYETKIEGLTQLRKILEVLNFKPLIRVDKIRKTWEYKDYEIAVDSVKDLGDFVEIEYIGKDEKADPKKIAEEMINFLKGVGCGRIKRNYVGYPFQLLFPVEVRFEEQ